MWRPRRVPRFKPARSFGRLLHIQGPAELAFLESALPEEPFWLGMRAGIRGSPDWAAHWRWMEDLFSADAAKPWDPRPDIDIAIGSHNQCLR